MAKKDGDLFERILVNVLVGMAGAIFGAIVTHEEDPEKELQKLQTSGLWRVDIGPIACQNCRTINEALATNCINCGQKIVIAKTVAKKKNNFSSSIEKHALAIALILLASAGLFIALLVLMALSASAG